MTASTETKSEVDLIDEQAQEWLDDKFHFIKGQPVFSDKNMITAYRAGFAAGLGHARKVFAPERVEDTTGKPPLHKDTTGRLMKVLRIIAYRSSLFVRAKSLGSKDTQLLLSVHAMATNAIAAAQVPA